MRMTDLVYEIDGKVMHCDLTTLSDEIYQLVMDEGLRAIDQLALLNKLIDEHYHD